MNYLRKIPMLFIAAIAISFTACSDDDDDKDDEVTATSKIVNKNFYQTANTFTANGITQDFFSDLDPCDKDDFTIFFENGTGVDDEGLTKCDPSAPQVIGTFQWSIINNDAQIFITQDGFAFTGTILVNDGTSLAIELSETDDFDGDGDFEVGVNRIIFTAR